MSKEYPCVYYDNEKCKKFSDDEYTSYCLFGPCKDETPSNADRIRAMTDEELAEFLILSPEMEFDVCLYCEHVNPTPIDDRGWCLHDSEVRGYGTCLANAKAEAFKKWLQQPCGGADQ